MRLSLLKGVVFLFGYTTEDSTRRLFFLIFLINLRKQNKSSRKQTISISLNFLDCNFYNKKWE